jgi:hypothetical protein
LPPGSQRLRVEKTSPTFNSPRFSLKRFVIAFFA